MIWLLFQENNLLWFDFGVLSSARKASLWQCLSVDYKKSKWSNDILLCDLFVVGSHTIKSEPLVPNPTASVDIDD